MKIKSRSRAFFFFRQVICAVAFNSYIFIVQTMSNEMYVKLVNDGAKRAQNIQTKSLSFFLGNSSDCIIIIFTYSIQNINPILFLLRHFELWACFFFFFALRAFYCYESCLLCCFCCCYSVRSMSSSDNDEPNVLFGRMYEFQIQTQQRKKKKKNTKRTNWSVVGVAGQSMKLLSLVVHYKWTKQTYINMWICMVSITCIFFLFHLWFVWISIPVTAQRTRTLFSLNMVRSSCARFLNVYDAIKNTEKKKSWADRSRYVTFIWIWKVVFSIQTDGRMKKKKITKFELEMKWLNPARCV